MVDFIGCILISVFSVIVYHWVIDAAQSFYKNHFGPFLGDFERRTKISGARHRAQGKVTEQQMKLFTRAFKDELVKIFDTTEVATILTEMGIKECETV